MKQILKKTTLVALPILLISTLFVSCSNNEKITKTDFDLQAHRGGRGEYTEESIFALEQAAKLGVTTLEFDIVMTKDNVPLVWHDSIILEEKCSDTTGNFVGKVVHDLTFSEIQTLTCDKKLPNFADAKIVKGNKIATLNQVLSKFSKEFPKIKYNIETKLEAENPKQSPKAEVMVNKILDEAKKNNILDKLTIQSFDWKTFPIVKEKAPEVKTALLYDKTTWHKNSKWLGKIDYDKVDGNIFRAAVELGVDILSPEYSMTSDLKMNDKNFQLYTDENFIYEAHQNRLQVIPWTVNDPEVMKKLIEIHVDGIITDYPRILKKFLDN